MNLIRFTGMATCLVLSACSTFSEHVDTDDSLMGYLSTDQRKPIDNAQHEHDRRSYELATARQHVDLATKELVVSNKELALAEARVDKAEALVEVAETGTTEDLADSREEFRVIQASTVPQRELVRWHECEVARREQAETLAKRSMELSGARMDLEKARAFLEVDQASARHIDVGANEAHVREAEKRTSLAEVELEAATLECTVAKRRYDEAKLRTITKMTTLGAFSMAEVLPASRY